MPSSYTTSLRLTLPATGELAGQWGSTVNTGITELLDAAVAGTTVISTWGGAGVPYTLSNNSGTADEARKMFIVATGTPGEAKNVICPAVSKLYVFRNDTTGGFALTLKTSGGTGIAVPAGQYKMLYCDGTNVVEAVNSPGPVASLSASQAVFTDGSKNLVSNAVTGTGNVVMSASPTLTGTVAGASLQLSSLTSGRVTYAGASGLLQDSTNLTFDGTSLTLGGNPTLSAGTANGVLYLNASKVATSGSALTFNGADLTSSGNLNAGSNITAGLVNGGTTPSLTRGVFVESSANNAVVGYSLGVWDGANNRRGSMFLDDVNGLWGWDVTASSGVPDYVWRLAGTEQMRLTSTGLGIGTSSPSTYSLAPNLVVATASSGGLTIRTGSSNYGGVFFADGTTGDEQYRGYIQYNHNFAGVTDYMFFGTAGGTKMTLDSSGNLGLGVTPSAWNSSFRAIQLGGGASFWNGGAGVASTFVGNNYFLNASGNRVYIANGTAAEYAQLTTGAHVWYTAPSGTAGNAISFTQAMTLSASGGLSVGLTSDAGANNILLNAGGKLCGNAPSGSTSSTIELYNASTGNMSLTAAFSTAAITFASGGTTERARITSGGDFGIGNTNPQYRLTVDKDTTSALAFFTNSNASAPNGLYVDFSAASPNNTTEYFLYCEDSTAQRATIRSNGGLANYSGNDVNLSDRREKTNFAPAKPYLDTICAIPVQTFEYIDQSPDDLGLTLGVVAQDVQAVAPELVMESNWGTEDEPKMRLSIYQTDLQYALMKCIQELKAQNDELRARVAALEAQP